MPRTLLDASFTVEAAERDSQEKGFCFFARPKRLLLRCVGQLVANQQFRVSSLFFYQKLDIIKNKCSA